MASHRSASHVTNDVSHENISDLVHDAHVSPSRTAMKSDCSTVPRVWRARFRFLVSGRSARSVERGGNERSRAGHPRRDRVQLERWRYASISLLRCEQRQLCVRCDYVVDDGIDSLDEGAHLTQIKRCFNQEVRKRNERSAVEGTGCVVEVDVDEGAKLLLGDLFNVGPRRTRDIEQLSVFSFCGDGAGNGVHVSGLC